MVNVHLKIIYNAVLTVLCFWTSSYGDWKLWELYNLLCLQRWSGLGVGLHYYLKKHTLNPPRKIVMNECEIFYVSARCWKEILIVDVFIFHRTWQSGVSSIFWSRIISLVHFFRKVIPQFAVNHSRLTEACLLANACEDGLSESLLLLLFNF